MAREKSIMMHVDHSQGHPRKYGQIFFFLRTGQIRITPNFSRFPDLVFLPRKRGWPGEGLGRTLARPILMALNLKAAFVTEPMLALLFGLMAQNLGTVMKIGSLEPF